eukprot:1158600-Pelagomonas_calceolata.AAC.3
MQHYRLSITHAIGIQLSNITGAVFLEGIPPSRARMPDTALYTPAQLHTPVPRFVPVPWLPAWPGSSMHSGPWADPPCRMLLLLLLQPLSAEVAVPAETPGPAQFEGKGAATDSDT